MDYTTRLKQFRQTANISQREIADTIQITQQQYSRYEAGQNELPIRYLIVICKHFNISADWLLGLKEGN